uniref:Neprosin PEP catalytic domain-containing protein n=1 Tax=Ananas comosus var. bracteatus TaxID=296719 RepID=A0A6V7NNH8_ANACO|nr:unnamed protein product [Ananas comosus var. bracteatus]
MGPRPVDKRKNIMIRKNMSDFCNFADLPRRVNPDLYGDNQTRLFTLWTVDGYKNTGCYNLLCEGFVFTGKSNFGPGSVLEPVSVNEGRAFSLRQDPQSGDWWLHCRHDGYSDDCNLEQMGYWPRTLFTSLAHRASCVEWGGFVSHAENVSDPAMGNGDYPVQSIQGGRCSKTLSLCTRMACILTWKCTSWTCMWTRDGATTSFPLGIVAGTKPHVGYPLNF